MLAIKYGFCIVCVLAADQSSLRLAHIPKAHQSLVAFALGQLWGDTF